MSDRSAPPIFSAADLLSAPDLPPPWALPGLLPVGLTVLAYTPFAGQGKLALQVAAACAAGRPTLGAEPPGPASVLYIAPGQAPGGLRARLQALSVPAESVGGLELACTWPEMFDGDGLNWISGWLAARRGRVVVLEAVPGVFGSISESGLRALRAVAHHHGAAVLVLVRCDKPGRDVLEESATRFAHVSDALWVLQPRRGGAGECEATLTVAAGDGPPRALALTLPPGAGEWECGGPERERSVGRRRRELLDVLLEAPLGMKPAEIARASGRPARAVRRMLFDMLRDGQVLRCPYGMYYHPAYEEDRRQRQERAEREEREEREERREREERQERRERRERQERQECEERPDSPFLIKGEGWGGGCESSAGASPGGLPAAARHPNPLPQAEREEGPEREERRER